MSVRTVLLQIVYSQVSALKPILFTFSFFAFSFHFQPQLENLEQIGFLSFFSPLCLLTVWINLFAQRNRKSLSIAGNYSTCSLRVSMAISNDKRAKYYSSCFSISNGAKQLIEWWQEVCVSNFLFVELENWICAASRTICFWRSINYPAVSFTPSLHASGT